MLWIGKPVLRSVPIEQGLSWWTGSAQFVALIWMYSTACRELVAQTLQRRHCGATFICAELVVQKQSHTASYVKRWWRNCWEGKPSPRISLCCALKWFSVILKAIKQVIRIVKHTARVWCVLIVGSPPNTITSIHLALPQYYSDGQHGNHITIQYELRWPHQKNGLVLSVRYQSKTDWSQLCVILQPAPNRFRVLLLQQNCVLSAVFSRSP